MLRWSKFFTRWGGVSLALLATGCSSLKSQPAAPLASADLERLTRCDSAPAAVRERLQQAGYRINDASGGSFTTDFKLAEAETESFLLGATSDEYLRQYRVMPEGSGSRFELIYQHTRYPHSGERERGADPLVTTGPRSWRADQLELLTAIHAEACGGPLAAAPPPVQPRPAPAAGVVSVPQSAPAASQSPAAPTAPGPATRSNPTLDYLLGKCRDGDRVACDLLRQDTAQ